ncbi:hypothetical protein [Geomonas propionica]|uniref:Uncharacterized protein n=1 Tax=Geomonas propionica TaxID=2798582 RepID=A0ABS0YVK3_9BACT|nr:hypothetical protein [Geomonas propionica]MBJ6801951.1 hypothetical protein [Geomonas propionica]
MPTPSIKFALRITVLTIAVSFVAAGPVHAYVDPNTGGYVFQVLFPIISAIAGIFLFFKRQAGLLIQKFLNLFKSK